MVGILSLTIDGEGALIKLTLESHQHLNCQYVVSVDKIKLNGVSSGSILVNLTLVKGSLNGIALMLQVKDKIPQIE